MIFNYDDLKKTATFGVAGNFTGHLEQAGEARDFVNIKTESANAPKALFPTYLPKLNGITPEFLNVFPFDEHQIIFPKNEEKLQIEPECAIYCDVVWSGDKIASINPLYFFASNDCSIRREGAKKISEKKNWGLSSKGVSTNFLKIDSFAQGGIMDRYRIASFLIRDGKIFDYGEDSRIKDYSYFYEKLLDWCIAKLNGQKDEGPAENLNSYLAFEPKVSNIVISVGATRYTEFGEKNFLQTGDDAVVVVYPEEKYSHDDVVEMVKKGGEMPSEISVLCQKIIL